MEGIPQFTCGCALADSYSNPVFMVGKYMKDGPLKIELYEYRNNSKWEKASGLLRSFPNGSYQASTLDGMIRNSLLKKLTHDYEYLNLLYIGCSLSDEIDLLFSTSMANDNNNNRYYCSSTPPSLRKLT